MKYSKYSSYKDSGVEWLGEIPVHWSTYPLKRIADIRLSNVDKHSVEDQQVVRLCNYVDVYKNERITNNLTFMRATASDDQISRLSLKRGDVIITKDSESPDDIGVPAFVDDEFEDVVCGYHLALLRPMTGKAAGSYIHRTLQSIFLRSQFSIAATGMTRYGLAKYSIENSVFPLPPESEQAAIAAFLDAETAQIDTLIAKQERLIALLQEKRQALISHAVTKGLNPDAPMVDSGVEWLGEIPAHWEISGFTKYLDIVDYRGRTPQKVDDGMFLVTARNIKGGKIDYSLSEEYVDAEDAESLLNRGRPEVGDVLMTTEAPLGEVANVDRVDFALAQRIIKLRGVPERLNNYFLKYWIMSSFFQQHLSTLATGSTALGIKGAKLHMLKTILPPLTEQEKIVAYIEEKATLFDSIIARSVNITGLLQERRTALISAAVTGKIDVRSYMNGSPP